MFCLRMDCLQIAAQDHAWLLLCLLTLKRAVSDLKYFNITKNKVAVLWQILQCCKIGLHGLREVSLAHGGCSAIQVAKGIGHFCHG